MSGEKGSTYANSLLALIFQGTAITGLAMNTTTSPLTSLYVSLHTADPTASGNQTSSESAYTGYARVAVARSSGGFTLTSNSVSPASTISFPACTGGTSTVTYFAIGTAASGTGEVLYAGPVSPTISVSNGVTPQLTTATAVTES